MTANRPQPTRYRPGKAEVEDASSDEESSEGQNEEQAAPARAPAPKATSFPSKPKLAVDISKAGQQPSQPASAQVRKTEDDLEGFVTASESSEDEDAAAKGSSEEAEDSDSSDEEESTSEDEPKKPMLAPKFISKAKRNREAPAAKQSTVDQAAEEERIRKEKADVLLQAQIERDRAARAAGKKFWDDDDNFAPEDEVDDTDGIDVEGEFAAWKLRELKRVRRDRLAIEEKEKEREEIERRRNLTQEEREVEDKEFIEQQQGDGEKSRIGYMQKYFHKGAFFNTDDQDTEVQAALNRNFAGAKFEDETGDKAVLPEYMRIRDMTRLGRKGRTKYRDLKSEDTGRWGADVGRRKREFEGGVDERFRPDGPDGGGRERSGANAVAVGERRVQDEEGRGERSEKRTRYE